MTSATSSCLSSAGNITRNPPDILEQVNLKQRVLDYTPFSEGTGLYFRISFAPILRPQLEQGDRAARLFSLKNGFPRRVSLFESRDLSVLDHELEDDVGEFLDPELEGLVGDQLLLGRTREHNVEDVIGF